MAPFAAPAAHSLVACSSAMVQVVELAERLAPLPRPIVLVGQSGVGKGLLARYIHSHSGRPGAFVAVAGGELADSLLHDQLVGHEAGAFTGALRRVRGAFERAQGGTLFLDELPLWSPAAQSALLRAVDEGVITRLGAERSLDLDCRLLFGSNRPLDQLMEEEELRPDLRWRMQEFVIEIPPLAARRVDIAAMGYHFLDRARQEFGWQAPVWFAPEALQQLLTYAWPGNVRQLKGVVEWSFTQAAFQQAERIEPRHLPLYVQAASRGALGQELRSVLSVWAFERAGRDRKAAAALLGVHPNTIDYHRRAAASSQARSVAHLEPVPSQPVRGRGGFLVTRQNL